MSEHVPSIVTPHLTLVSLAPAFLVASLARDRAQAERLLGLRVPDEWFDEHPLIALRLDDLRADPTWRPWLLRAVGLTTTGEMIGHIGFHTPPGAAYLEAYAPRGIELGYTIFPAHRRRGHAGEAVAAMLAWAAGQGVPRFVLSIGPDNEASLRLAQRHGFVRVGTRVDAEDGPEEVFVRQVGGTTSTGARTDR